MSVTVADVMNADPARVHGLDPVRAAAERMREAGTGDVLVWTEEGLAGLLTDRDIVVRWLALGADPAILAGDICTEELITVGPSATLPDALALMVRHAVRRLPVVAAGRAVGIVTLPQLVSEEDPSSALGRIALACPHPGHGVAGAPCDWPSHLWRRP